MKKILIFIFLTTSISFSQTKWKQDSVAQKNNYKFALEYLEKNDTINVIRNLYFTYKYGEKTRLGIKVKNKLDSLVEIKKAELLNNISGKWKLNKTGSNWSFSDIDKKFDTEDILIINSDSITFYKKEKSSNTLEVIKSEKIKFTEICYNCEESMFYFYFSDNQIWIFKPNDNTTMLHLKNDGSFRENGNRTKISCGNSEMTYEKIK